MAEELQAIDEGISILSGVSSVDEYIRWLETRTPSPISS